MKRLIMQTREQKFEIELNNSDTANAIWLAAPFEGYANVWGEEIYFEIPVDMEVENGKQIMDVGEVAYWPQGNAFCLFFGPTPASEGKEPVAVSDVSPVGKVVGDPGRLRDVGDRTKIEVKQA